MTENHVRIHGDGLSHVLEVDGHPLQNLAGSADLSIRAGKLPVLTVCLVPHLATDVDIRAYVRIAEESAEALKALGWTPPEAAL